MRPHRSPLPISFFAFGVLWGAWQAALPDLSRHYGLTPGPLGVLLTVGFAISLPVMLLAGRLLDRAGPGRTIALAAGVMAAGLLIIAVLPPLPLLVLAVVLMLSGSGALDVAINGAAMGDEGWRRPVQLTLLHAAFSGGGAIGALAGGALVGAGIAFVAAYVTAALMMAAIAWMAASSRWTPPARGGRVPGAIARAMLPLAVLTALAFLVEGGMETWSAIFLRDELGAAAFVGALGPAAFHTAMLIGRLVGAGVAGALGAASTLLVAGSMTVAGMALALVAPTAAPALVGMVIAALGASFVVPVVVSLAAARAGAHAGRAASYVLSLGYAGFLVGPSLIGILGEVAGLRAALVVVPVAAAIVAAASRTRVARADER